jgi:hypothetical protein
MSNLRPAARALKPAALLAMTLLGGFALGSAAVVAAYGDFRGAGVALVAAALLLAPMAVQTAARIRSQRESTRVRNDLAARSAPAGEETPDA